MFCTKCGAQIKENAKFCTQCGTPVANISPNKDSNTVSNAVSNAVPNTVSNSVYNVPSPEPEISEKKKKGKGGLIAVIAALVLVLVAGIGAGLYMFVFSEDAQYKRCIAAAEKCVDDEDYEEAAGYYLNAIRIKNDDEDSYIALAEAYEEIDDIDKAIAILEEGIDNTDSKRMQKLLDRYQDSETAAEAPASGSDVTTSSDEPADMSAATETAVPYTGEKKNVNIGVRQVDTSNFPEIVLYASITDEAGEAVEGMNFNDFKIQEISEGRTTDATIEDVYRVINNDRISVNLVMDASGSMSEYSKITQAKNAAKGLVNQMKLSAGDQVEVISFDDYVYLEQEFTNNQPSLNSAIDGIDLGDMTALYDGLYAGLYQTYYESGAKCVIGFTDGLENASSYTYYDVVEMSKNTGIPVFIIGIGEEYDAYELENLAMECSGQYYSANANNLETILEDIYLNIYHEQQDYYVLKYKTQNTDNKTQFRDVVVQTSETSEYVGNYKKEYIPEADVTGAFSGSYMNKDYMISDSNTRTVTEADLAGMSLAELRIARNEIFARHGRQFKDSMLNQWFYSKVWYLNIGAKYAPDTFDAMNPSLMSRLEIDNANFIKNYEQSIMDNQDIYPNASNTRLSDYDLALSKPVLKTALSQMQNYPSTAILEENKRLVQDAINKEDVRY